MGLHDGHRKRVKEKFKAHGLAPFAEHEVLELLLFYAIPQGDVNELAHTLIQHFGSLSAVLDADATTLEKVSGVGEHTATLLALMLPLAARYRHSKSDSTQQMNHFWQMEEQLAPYFMAEREECVYLMCLDSRQRMLAIRRVSGGSINAVAVTLRRVMEVALSAKATCLVLAHNHPGGCPQPSPDDLATTSQLDAALKDVGITLWDHLIFADGEAVSLRRGGAWPE